MIRKPFDKIGKGDIEELVNNSVGESKALEYKLELNLSNDDGKRELLKDVSAMANSSGGLMIVGIEEERDPSGRPTGLPKSAVGLDVNVDREITRIHSIIRDGIDPRIPSIRINSIGGFSNGAMILIKIIKSWSSPHMVTYKNFFPLLRANQ